MGRVRNIGCIFYFCKHGIPLTCQCTWIWFQVASSLKLARTAAASAALFMGALSESLLQSNCHWDYGGSMRDCYFCAVECAKRLLLVTVGLCLRIHADLWQLSCRGKAKSLAIHTKNTTCCSAHWALQGAETDCGVDIYDFVFKTWMQSHCRLAQSRSAMDKNHDWQWHCEWLGVQRCSWASLSCCWVMREDGPDIKHK